MRRFFSRIPFLGFLAILIFALGSANCSSDDTPPTQQLKAFCAFVLGQGPDLDTEWLGGSNGLLLKSTDKGENWIQIDPGFNYAISDLDFNLSGQYGYAVGPDGMYAQSNDFGANWTSQMLGTTINPDLHDLTWAPGNDQLGWIVGDGGSIYFTNDQGANWGLQDSKSTENLYGICFSDQNFGFAVGDNGTILGTNDGGQNWDIKNSGIGLSLRYCLRDPFSNNLGLVAGFGGTILETDDNGDTWNAQNTGITNDLYSLAIKPDFSGKILAAGDGIIIRTEDFGNTWTTVFDEFDAAITLFLKRVLYALDGNAYAVGRTGLGDGFDFGMVPNLLPTDEEALSDGLTVESNDDGVNWLQVQIKVQF